MASLALEGVYKDGKVELVEQPADLTQARVLVVFLPARSSQEQAEPTRAPDEARRAAGRRLLALIEKGAHLGGPPYPKREELYDRVDRYGRRDG